MSDFLSAIQAGISSAKAGEAAAREISQIIIEVTRTLEAATSRRATLVIEENSIIATIAKVSASLSGQGSTFTSKSLRLLVRNIDQSASKGTEIGTLSTSSNGYPVLINWAAVTNSASDGPGLRKAFADLLSRPETGRAILIEAGKSPTSAPPPATTPPQRKIRKV